MPVASQEKISPLAIRGLLQEGLVHALWLSRNDPPLALGLLQQAHERVLSIIPVDAEKSLMIHPDDTLLSDSREQTPQRLVAFWAKWMKFYRVFLSRYAPDDAFRIIQQENGMQKLLWGQEDEVIKRVFG